MGEADGGRFPLETGLLKYVTQWVTLRKVGVSLIYSGGRMTMDDLSAFSVGELIYLATAKYMEEIELRMRRHLGDVDPSNSRVIGLNGSRIVSLQNCEGDVVAMYEIGDEGLSDVIP